jgi:uncharacterized protein YdaU (DUF1376 family)
MSGPYFKHFTGESMRDTDDLGTAETAAYYRLMVRQWNRGPLPDDDRELAKIARVAPAVWNRIARTMKAIFLPGEDGRLALPWMEKQRGKLIEISEKRAAAGAVGGRSKALNAKDSGLANARTLPEVCQPDASPIRSQKIEDREDTASLRESAAADATAAQVVAPPAQTASVAAAGPAEVVDFADEAARVRSQLWGEGKGIITRVAPAMPGKKVGNLIGMLAKAYGGGIRGGTRAIHVLRDVEAKIAGGEVAGYGAAPTPEAAASALEKYLHGVIQRAGRDASSPQGPMPLGGADPEPPRNTNAHIAWERRQRLARHRAQQQSQSDLPEASGPVIDGKAERLA